MNETHFKTFLVSLALVVHLNRWYILSDDWLDAMPPNVSSLIFLLSAALMAIQNLEPPTTAMPWPPSFVYTYKVMIMLYVPCKSLRYFWLPLIYSIAACQNQLAQFLKTLSPESNPDLFMLYIKLLKCPGMQAIQQLFISLFILYSVTYAIGAQNKFKKWLQQFTASSDCPKDKNDEIKECSEEESDEEDCD